MTYCIYVRSRQFRSLPTVSTHFLTNCRLLFPLCFSRPTLSVTSTDTPSPLTQYTKDHIPLETGFEMYMANAKILRLVPSATYIPLTCFGVSRWGNANFMFGVGCFRVSRYQHVGIPNAKFSHWGCYPTPDPNAKGLASQWNIGLKEDISVFSNLEISPFSRTFEPRKTFS